MNAVSPQQVSVGKASGFFNALWPTLFWLAVLTALAISRPDPRFAGTAHKGQIMPAAPPASTAAVRPCR